MRQYLNAWRSRQWELSVREGELGSGKPVRVAKGCQREGKYGVGAGDGRKSQRLDKVDFI